MYGIHYNTKLNKLLFVSSGVRTTVMKFSNRQSWKSS